MMGNVLSKLANMARYRKVNLAMKMDLLIMANSMIHPTVKKSTLIEEWVLKKKSVYFFD